MLVIYFANSKDLVGKVLSFSPMVKIGLISYGIYLWHYPIFALSRINNIEPSQLDKLSWILASLVLAAITFFLIERPFRNRSTVRFKVFSLIITFQFLLISSIATFAFSNDGKWGRFEDWQLRYIEGSREYGGDFTTYVVKGYSENVLNKNFSADSRKKILLIGDSFSQDFYNVLFESRLLKNIDVVGYLISNRCMFPTSIRYSKEIEIENDRICDHSNRIGTQSLNSLVQQSDAIVVASAWIEFTTAHVEELERQLYTNGSKKTIFIGRKHFPSPTTSELIDLTYQDITTLRKPVSDWHYRIVGDFRKKKLNNYVDLHTLVCGYAKDCPVSTPNGFLISYDGGHLSREGAVYVGSILKNSPIFTSFWRELNNPPIR